MDKVETQKGSESTKQPTKTTVAVRHLYTPILRGKQGELNALKNLTSEQKEGLLPLIEVEQFGALPDDKKDRTDAIQKQAQKLVSSWGKDRPFFCDFENIEQTYDQAEVAQTYIDHVIANTNAVVPVIAIEPSDLFHSHIQNRLDKIAGLCIRITQVELEDESWIENLGNIVRGIDLAPGKIHVLFDFGASVPQNYIAAAILSALPEPKQWASVIVASTSMPISISGYTDGGMIERTDYLRFCELSRKNLAVKPVYGDYAMVNPNGATDLNFALIPLYAKVKYTNVGSWSLFKGKALKKGGSKDFPLMAQKVMALTEWKGPDFSWGDKRISEIANSPDNPGNLGTWVAISTNHHIVLTLSELAKLP